MYVMKGGVSRYSGDRRESEAGEGIQSCLRLCSHLQSPGSRMVRLSSICTNAVKRLQESQHLHLGIAYLCPS